MFFKDLLEDAQNIVQKDPACTGIFSAMLFYPGFHILIFHQIAHFCYIHKCGFLARFISRDTEDF